jgi:hypothetical protein
MIAYFAKAPEGAAMLALQPRLAAWGRTDAARPSFAATEPALPG